MSGSLWNTVTISGYWETTNLYINTHESRSSWHWSFKPLLIDSSVVDKTRNQLSDRGRKFCNSQSERKKKFFTKDWQLVSAKDKLWAVEKWHSFLHICRRRRRRRRGGICFGTSNINIPPPIQSNNKNKQLNSKHSPHNRKSIWLIFHAQTVYPGPRHILCWEVVQGPETRA